MIYELFLEGELADIRQDLGMQLSFNIDDINKYGSRDTSFSKTIVLPGTARNNKLLGFVGELGSFNEYELGVANINYNFNAAQTTKAELRANGLLLIKGVFRLTGIVKDRDIIEYEGNLFGELGGFIAAIGKGKLDELDFSSYDHVYNRTNIVNSWDTINGSGYYYPLIDYGTFSVTKVDYDYLTLRPALFAKEYIDKIFSRSGFTYESNFINSNFFKKLIIPNNQKGIFKKGSYAVEAIRTTAVTTSARIITMSYETTTLSSDWVTNVGKTNFTYVGATSQTFRFNFIGTFTFNSIFDAGWTFEVRKNGVVVYTTGVGEINGQQIRFEESGEFSVVTNDVITVRMVYPQIGDTLSTTYDELILNFFNSVSAPVQVTINGSIEMNETIPKGIFQKDFFTWIIKMFNLYVTEDKIKQNHLIIEPYKDYYNLSTYIDWTYKIARDKPLQIKPMGMLNGRFFEYVYKDDNDFYNENYKKKYNLAYGSNLQDTGFQFSKNKQTIDIGFSPSVLVQYDGTDKILPAIYKKSKGNSVDQEELTDSNIRILLAKKISCGEWFIKNGASNLGAGLTVYGYAGHFDDPVNPTVDINFGAASEIYFDPNVYPSANLFNTYWSGYIAEIADKDSKLLTCHVYLTELDIAQLDFSKPVFIDGVLWRINKVIDFDAASGELTKVELLKIIDTSYSCAIGWTKTNYTGTTFRNGDTIPQVTDPTAWANLTTPAWCYYDNDSANEATYGKLYNWYAINDPRGFAPDGYRLPTDADWTGLTDCLGGESVAGGKMKSITGWASPNTDATNESGFSGLPGGLRDPSGSFNGTTFDGYWWSSTDGDANNAYARYLNFSFGDVIREFSDKNYGFSVRLIKI